MKTKLIAVTKPLNTLGETLTPEEFIVYIARVSNPTNQLNTSTGEKLLNYLIKHKHWSPFEHVSATFEIKTSRAIAAQILRHRSFTFQEFSQRYAMSTELEAPEWRMQGKTNRQVGDEPVVLPDDIKEIIDVAQQTSVAAYYALIEKGIAKECARMVLPLNTQTTIYMTGSLRSWIHYLELRCEQGTQKEHRDIALEIEKSLKEVFPQTFNALDKLLS
jgi:thymidylate synthase (FAD)